jgi:starch synthase
MAAKQTPKQSVKQTNQKAAEKSGSAVKVLFVASECAPFAKTGGLADAVAGLSKALVARGHEVRVVIPLYSAIDRVRFGISADGSACVHMGEGEEQWVGVHSAMLDGVVPVWLVECDRYFGRPGYYDFAGQEYGDNGFRFALFSKAALQLCKDHNWIPDVAHVHDWPAALTSVFLKTWDRILSPLSNTGSVLTIHNIGYQGVYHGSLFPYIGIGIEHFNSDGVEDHGRVNLLKAGINYSDAITTVSPTHAHEILDPIGGHGLAPYLNHRRADLFGILNGADYEHWNPATDKLIPANFTADDLSGKALCKRELQARFGLEIRDDVPVFGIVSRFAAQKGFNLLMEALPRVLNDMNLQIAVLGSGDANTENFFHWLTATYGGRVGSYIGFSNQLAHLVEAGSDFFLMPSLYEPCGLNQIYSLKYATLPLVHATGGLDDTVENYDVHTGSGTGFKFWEASGGALYDTIGWANQTWWDRPHHIAQLRQNAMAQHFSWDDAAPHYERAYAHAIAKRRGG